MRRTVRRPIVAVLAWGFVAVAILGSGRAARTAGADDPKPTKEAWVFEKKTVDTSDRVEIDVTKMPAAERSSLEERYTKQGYRKSLVILTVRDAGLPPAGQPPVDVGAMLLDLPRRIERLKVRLQALEERIAKDDRLPDPLANAATRSIEEIRPKATVAVGRTVGLVLAKVMSEQKDPEKAAAYRKIFEALALVVAKSDSHDPHELAHAALDALIALLPTMRDPKGAQVLRELLATVRSGLLADPSAVSQASVPEFGAGKPTLGPLFADRLGLRPILREAALETAGRGLGGARLEPLGLGLEGFHVESVRAGSKAAQLGLTEGDTIIQLGGGAATPKSLRDAVHALRVGGELSVTVIRQGVRIPLKAIAASTVEESRPPAMESR